MKIIRDINETKRIGPSVVTIGVFDGVHLGHQAIMRAVTDSASMLGAESVVITFEKSPLEIIKPDTDVPYINTLDQKLRFIEQQGVGLIVLLPMDEALVNMAAEEFIADVVIQKLSARQIVVGSNFAFGKGRAGNVRLLGELAGRFGYELTVVPPVKHGEHTISSTFIRGLIRAGRMDAALTMLGRPFMLSGMVVPGMGIGRGLGFPTANIQPAEKQIVPADGVYAASVESDGKKWPAAVNIGSRPTLDNLEHAVEAHLIGFSGDLYRENLEVEFLHRLRSEIKFPDDESLKKQISNDVQHVLRMI